MRTKFNLEDPKLTTHGDAKAFSKVYELQYGLKENKKPLDNVFGSFQGSLHLTHSIYLFLIYIAILISFLSE